MSRFEPGDIFACYGADAVSRTITLGTINPFAPKGLRLGPSHVAIAAPWRRPRSTYRENKLVWIESTSLSASPCLIRKGLVSGMQAHEPKERLKEYASGRVDLYRLTDIQKLTSDEGLLLGKILVEHFIEREIAYDYQGALLAGMRAFQRTRLFPGADLHSVFCSEVVAACLMRLFRMNRKNPTRYSPASLLRELVDQGTYALAERDVRA